MSGLTRVGLLADTHGQLDARIADPLTGCDVIVHAGDIGCISVLQRLRELAPKVVAVRGNNDIPAKLDADSAALAELPLSESIALPGGQLDVVHGDRAGAAARRHARLRREHPAARAIVYGHSHRQCLDCDEQPWVLNPGAAGRARTYGGPSCLILTATTDEWQVEAHRVPPLKSSR